jgi:peptide/nickel transport system permease protein
VVLKDRSRRVARLVVRRFLLSIPVLLLGSMLSFGFVRAAVDPLATFRGASSDNGVTDATAVSLERHRLGIDKPVAVQYLRWLNGFTRGHWGLSTVSRRSVAAEIRQKLWNTTQLIGWAILAAAIVGIAVGVVVAARQYSILDHLCTGASFVGLSMPPFWFALVAIELLVFVPKQSLHLDHPLLYSVGLHSSAGGGVLDYPRHLALPVLTLALPLAARWSRYQRSSILDVLSSTHLTTARSKGLSERRVLVRHGLRNALIPLTTVMAQDMGVLLGGVIITETIFAIPGMGQLLYASLLAGDTNVLLPWLMVVASFGIAFNLMADILYGVLDPRIGA